MEITMLFVTFLPQVQVQPYNVRSIRWRLGLSPCQRSTTCARYNCVRI